MVQWTTEWWKWFLSIPKEAHPVYDETGEKWAVNQCDPNVIFLVATIGGKAERSITIPTKKAVLLPVINFTMSYAEDPSLKNDIDLVSRVKTNIDDIVQREVYVDDTKLVVSEEHRVSSAPFDFTFPRNNIYGVKGGPTRGAGDGYWIFLKPLSTGKHSIWTFGACLSGRIQIELRIELVVEE
jgi:hypothetical protein